MGPTRNRKLAHPNLHINIDIDLTSLRLLVLRVVHLVSKARGRSRELYLQTKLRPDEWLLYWGTLFLLPKSL
jgi:hypothetical protein